MQHKTPHHVLRKRKNETEVYLIGHNLYHKAATLLFLYTLESNGEMSERCQAND